MPAVAVFAGLQFLPVSAMARHWWARGHCRAESAGNSEAKCVTVGASFSLKVSSFLPDKSKAKS